MGGEVGWSKRAYLYTNLGCETRLRMNIYIGQMEEGKGYEQFKNYLL